MVNFGVLIFLMVYIIAATLGITLYVGSSATSESVITGTLQYGTSPVAGLQQNNSTINIDNYITTLNGIFNWDTVRGLYATRLYNAIGIGTIAQGTFGQTSVSGNIENESYALSGLSYSPSDNIGILMDYHTANSGSDAYYSWLFVSENDIWIQQEHIDLIPLLGVATSILHDTTVIQNNLNNNRQLADNSNVSYSYNYNNGDTKVLLNNIVIYQGENSVIANAPLNVFTTNNPAKAIIRPEQIRLNNENISIITTGNTDNLITKNSNQDPWFYATVFMGVAGWGVDNNVLPWYWHLLLITLFELILIAYIALSILHG